MTLQKVFHFEDMGGGYTNTQEMARLRELAGLEDTNHD